MKKTKIKPHPLILDVADYLFVEWLVRNKCYSRFVANLSNRSGFPDTREGVRAYLSAVLCSRVSTLRDAISAAFLFPCTPEGSDYWRLVDRKWIDFLEKLDVEL